MDPSFTIVCIFSTKFRSFQAVIEVAEQPPNKRCRNSSFLGNRCAPSFQCLSYLLQQTAKSATEDRFQRRRPTRLTLSMHAVRSIGAPFNPWDCRDNKLAGSRHGEWTCSAEIRLPHRELLHLHACLPRLRFLCARRPTSASSKSSPGSNV